MSKKKWTNTWDYTSLVRKDFRADKGSGPEEMPHRSRKGGGSKVCKRAKVKGGPHDFTAKVWAQVWRSRYDFEEKRSRYERVMIEVPACARCGRRRDRYPY